MDPIYNLGWSNYCAFKSSPISVIDPTGEADYYNQAGDWVGTDGVDDGIKRVVTDKDVLKSMIRASKRGQNYTAAVPNGTFYQLPRNEVNQATINTFNASQKDVVGNGGTIIAHGGMHEAGMTFDSEGNPTPIVHGSDMSINNPDAHVLLPESGSISIHTHPTGVISNPVTNRYKSHVAELSLSNSPDPNKPNNDEGAFLHFNLNIIVGFDILYEQTTQTTGGVTRVVDQTRTLVVNFYQGVKKVFTITYEALTKINNGNEGKIRKKYDKKRNNNNSGTVGSTN